MIAESYFTIWNLIFQYIRWFTIVASLFTVMIVVPQWCLSWYPFSDKWVENDPSTFGLYNKSLI